MHCAAILAFEPRAVLDSLHEKQTQFQVVVEYSEAIGPSSNTNRPSDSSEEMCALFSHGVLDGEGADYCGRQGGNTLADLKEPFISRFKVVS